MDDRLSTFRPALIACVNLKPTIRTAQTTLEAQLGFLIYADIGGGFFGINGVRIFVALVALATQPTMASFTGSACWPLHCFGSWLLLVHL